MTADSRITPSCPSDQEVSELIERYSQGDQQALDQLLARYRQEICGMVDHRLAPQLRSRLDGSDIAQEALLDASRRIGEFLADRPMPFRWWLRKLALQRLGKAVSRHRMAKKRSVECEQSLAPAASSIAMQIAGVQRPPDSDLALRELVESVHAALATLPPIDQELLTMRYHEKLTNVQIGYLLGLTPDAVNKRHTRSLLRLRQVMVESVNDPK